MGRLRKSSGTRNEFFDGQHRFEHWYRDNSVYFITSKVRDGFQAFATEQAKQIFWLKFDQYTKQHGFVPWVTSLLDNHYHTIGYLKHGKELGEMMRKIHGSIAWMVMKEIDVRHVPFWRNSGRDDYFDGCIRDVLQAERAYRYTLLQAVRARIVSDWRNYPHTHANVEKDWAIRRASERNAYMEEVPYARYERRKQRHGHQR